MDRGGDLRPPYEAVARLSALASDQWPSIDGWCAAQGVDPLSYRPDRFYNLIYAWAVERVEDKAKFDAQLEAPIPGRVRRASVTSLRQETNDLRGLATWASSVQGGR